MPALKQAERIVVRVAVAASVAFAGAYSSAVFGRDKGQWENVSPRIKEWYRNLMQPDQPTASCCGEADAYWADEFEVRGDQYVAIITDDRDDEPLMRPHIAPGTKFVVPNKKLKFDSGNPTGHGVLFVHPSGIVHCYVVPGGI